MKNRIPYAACIVCWHTIYLGYGPPTGYMLTLDMCHALHLECWDAKRGRKWSD